MMVVHHLLVVFFLITLNTSTTAQRLQHSLRAITPVQGYSSNTAVHFNRTASGNSYNTLATTLVVDGNIFPELLYKQQRVEYTFAIPVSLAPVELLKDGWVKDFAAFPCLQCYVTDAGFYAEYAEEANTQLAFLSGDQFKALLDHCASAPGKVTQACWDAAGLGDVEIEAYPYQTYAYHDKGTTPVFEGTYLVFNNGDNPVNIEYGMAYFGLNPGAPSEPGGLVVKEGEGLTPTRLKEIVQGLQRPVLIPKATDSLDIPGQRKKEIRPVEERASSVERTSKSLRVAGSKAERVEGTWTRYALAMGNEVANNGYNWWSNAGATYEGGNLVASFLSGDLYIKLRTACPQTTEEGLLIVTSDCWKQISNRSTIPKILASGERIERDYDGRADPNEGGSCVDGWWIFMNESKSTGANVVKADANFGLRTLGNNPRDA